MAFLLMTFYFSVVIPRMWSRCVFNMPDEILGASILWHLYRYYGILGHRSSHGSLARTGQVSNSYYRNISCTRYHVNNNLEKSITIKLIVLFALIIRSFLQMVGAVGVALAIEYDRNGIFTFLVPGGIGILLLVGAWVRSHWNISSETFEVLLNLNL